MENLNPARNLLILLVSLSPIGIMLRILSLNTNTQLNGSIFRVMDQITTYESNVFLSVVAALSYALNYRKIKNPKEIAKLFLQVMITIPLILFLCEVFRSEIGFDSPNQQLDKHDERKASNPIYILMRIEASKADASSEIRGNGNSWGRGFIKPPSRSAVGLSQHAPILSFFINGAPALSVIASLLTDRIPIPDNHSWKQLPRQ